MDAFLQDLRYAVRTLGRSPAFTVAAVLTLALGIGANTAIFSVVDGVLLRPAAFSELDRLAMVWETDRASGTTREPASVPDYQDFVARSRTFASIAALASMELNLTGGDAEPRRLATVLVSRDFFPTVGLTPLLGRTFNEEEDRPGGTVRVVISEEFWESVLNRDPAVLGRTLRLNDADREIIGVMPRGADFGTLQILGAASYGRGFAERGGRVRVDIWGPLRADPVSSPRSTHPILLLGRLAPGASVQGAQDELATIASEIEAADQANTGRGVNVELLGDVIFGRVRPAMGVLLAAVALVLLVACANVANLMLVRGADRLREVTVRAALGAGARRLARQFLVEGAVLTGAGAVLGVLLAVFGLEALLRLAPGDIPRIDAIGIDGRVLAGTLAVSVVVGLLFGALPIIQAFRTSLQPTLAGAAGRGASGGLTQGRFRAGMVVTELALAVMLMVGAGLMIRSLWRLQQVDPGFRAEGVLKAEYQLPGRRYPRSNQTWPRWTETTQFNADLVRRTMELPGVQSATVASVQPMAAGFTSSVVVVGREAEARDWPEPAVRPVGAGYFSTMGVPVTAGRPFSESDDADAPTVAIINRSAAERYFGTRDPMGQRLRMWGAERTIVGVVGNERFRGLDQASPPAVYYPLPQAPSFTASYSLLVRHTGSPDAVAPSVRAVVRGMDPELPLFAVESLAQTVADSMGQRRFTMIVLGAFAAIALFLAIIGVHGVLSYAVTQRRREIGIRMALGADGPSVRAMVLSQGAVLAGVGLAAGLLGALALTRLLGSLLYGVGTRDPMTFGGVAVLLGAAALAATYLPARRATLVDPVTALKAD